MQSLADPLESPDTTPQPGEFLQRGIATAATVEETVDFVHDTAKRSQLGPSTGDAQQGPPLGGSENVLHEEITMLKQVPDFPFDPLGLPRRLASRYRLKS